MKVKTLDRLDRLEITAGFFPNRPMPEETIALYVVRLQDLPDEVLDIALTACENKCKFFPTIAEIREEANKVIEASNPNKLLEWDQAWTEIMDGLRHNSYLKPPEWSCEEVKQTVQALGGWLSLCEMLEADLPIVRAQGRDIFNQILKRKKQKLELEQTIKRLSEEQKQRLGKVLENMLMNRPVKEIKRLEGKYGDNG